MGYLHKNKPKNPFLLTKAASIQGKTLWEQEDIQWRKSIMYSWQTVAKFHQVSGYNIIWFHGHCLCCHYVSKATSHTGNYPGVEVKRPGTESYCWHTLAVRPWINCVTYLYLNYLIHKRKIVFTILRTSWSSSGTLMSQCTDKGCENCKMLCKWKWLFIYHPFLWTNF